MRHLGHNAIEKDGKIGLFSPSVIIKRGKEEEDAFRGDHAVRCEEEQRLVLLSYIPT